MPFLPAGATSSTAMRSGRGLPDGFAAEMVGWVDRGAVVQKLNSTDRIDIEVDTVDGDETVHVGNADFVARFFFTSNESSVGPESVDDRALDDSHRSRFEESDLQLLLGATEKRGSSPYWENLLVIDPSPGWLTQLDPAWDLFRMPEASWLSQNCLASIAEAFEGLYGSHRRKAVITKLLYLKRPLLVPICDSGLAGLMRLRKDNPEALAAFVAHFREQGRKNLASLEVIQRDLESRGLRRSLPRILQAVLWCKAASSGPYWYYTQLVD